MTSIPTKPTPRLLTLHLAISLGLLMLLAACGGSDGSNGTAEAATSTEQPAGVQASAAPTAVPLGDSPIDNMIGVPIMDEAAMNDYVVDVLREGEFRTAECMLAEGFEYTPVAPTSQFAPTNSGNTDSDREFAAQRGFGIIAQFNESQIDLEDPPLHPNHVYRASLTPAEFDAYEVALWGAVTNESGNDSGQGEDSGFGPLSTGGCKALASEQLFELFMVLDEFTPDADSIFDAWQADPRVLASVSEWSRCMAELGFEIDHPDDVREPVIDQLDQVMQVFFSNLPSEIEPPAGYDERDSSNAFLSGDFWGPVPKLGADDQQKVDEIGAFEIELAVANFDCHEPRRESDTEIQHEYEQRLVDSIGSDLSARLGN